MHFFIDEHLIVDVLDFIKCFILSILFLDIDIAVGDRL